MLVGSHFLVIWIGQPLRPGCSTAQSIDWKIFLDVFRPSRVYQLRFISLLAPPSHTNIFIQFCSLPSLPWALQSCHLSSFFYGRQLQLFQSFLVRCVGMCVRVFEENGFSCLVEKIIQYSKYAWWQRHQVI